MSVLVVDVSNNNASVDMQRLRVAGIAGVIHKATEGATFTDGEFRGRVHDAHRAGLAVGLYHFARPDANPGIAGARREAAHFVAATRSCYSNGLALMRPVLDLEVGRAHASYVAWAREWNGVVRHELGAGFGPIFYSYPAYISELGASSPIGYGLWLASYGRNDGLEHPYIVPAPWHRAALHQFTSRARVAGVAGVCDLSAGASLDPLLVPRTLPRTP